MGEDALNGWLAAHLGLGRVPPRPGAKKGVAITVRPRLVAVLQIRWAREDQGRSQATVAARAGVSQQQIAKLENPDGNPTVTTVEKVAAALGQRLDLVLRAA